MGERLALGLGPMALSAADAQRASPFSSPAMVAGLFHYVSLSLFFPQTSWKNWRGYFRKTTILTVTNAMRFPRWWG